VTDGYTCRLARGQGERSAYFGLRRAIFCEEQRLFVGSDRDAIDDDAFPIVCLADSGRVVGVVRIWEDASGCWWGGRLGVHAEFRTVGAIGRWLVLAAVGTARAWGARQFRAVVQRPNVPFFRRMHWRSVQEVELLGQLHHLMEVEVERYAPTVEVRPPAAGTHDAAA
jgi:putative N-acetyltransferase (TIGR04045 family)